MENKIGSARSCTASSSTFYHISTCSLLWITGCEFGLISIPGLAVVMP